MKEWYTCELPIGKVLTSTLEECKAAAEKYMRGEGGVVYDGDYVIVYELKIFHHTQDHYSAEEVAACFLYDNSYRGKYPILIDYGVLGFIGEWDED